MRPTVVLLTGSQIQHRVVARALHDGPGLDHIVVDHGRHRGRVERLRTARRRFGVKGLASRVAWRLEQRVRGQRADDLAGVRAVCGDVTMPAGVVTSEVHGLRTSETEDLIRKMRPDILCIYGTAIVPDGILAMASTVALNLHTGISPQYRGADCAFWPLFFREPQWLGATVHVCTSDVDGGAVYGTVRAHLESSDGVGEVFGRTVVAGAQLYARVVSDILAGRATSEPQDLREGREFRAKMRTRTADRAVRELLAQGLIRDFVAAGQPATWQADTWVPGSR